MKLSLVQIQSLQFPSLAMFDLLAGLLKFIYSEKATNFCEIFPLLLTVCGVVKSKGKISQTFVAFSEYMNFNWENFIKIFGKNVPNLILHPNILIFRVSRRQRDKCRVKLPSSVFLQGCHTQCLGTRQTFDYRAVGEWGGGGPSSAPVGFYSGKDLRK